jgi:hypothetical protein
MTRGRILIYAVLALAIAAAGQHFWMTLFNPLVWHLTYIGVHLARAIYQPNYDSAASARTFGVLAVLMNAIIYFAVLLFLDRLVAALRGRKVS